MKFNNPAYGDGVFRRHVLIELTSPTEVFAALEDDAHAFALRLTHDGKVVTAVKAEWNRHPTTTCPGAVVELENMVGCPLSANPLAVRSYLQHLDQCTHFFDLTSSMISHVRLYGEDGDWPRRFMYKATVTDERDHLNVANLALNDEQVLEWPLRNFVVEGSGRFDGQNPLRGMTSWAADKLSDKELGWMLILQKALFVSMGRRMNFDGLAGALCKDVGQPLGSCYALRHGREEEARRLDSRRDYSEREEEVLRFIEVPQS